MNRLLVILAITALWACGNSIEEAGQYEDTAAFNEMSIYNIPAVWTTQEDEQIEFKDLKGNVLAVVMVYTQCKAACPRLVSDMQSIERKVKAKAKKSVKYVLVSIDPVNDTPERLQAFAKEYGLEGEQWILLQGNPESVREFANVVAVKYKQINPIDFSHSNIISVFDEEGVMQHQQEGLGVDNVATVSKLISLSK